MRNYILLLWTLISFIGQAQSRSSEAQLLLDQVSAKVKGYNSMTLEFKYVLENTEEKIRQETRGDVTLQGDKYILNILGITRIYD
jgi:outer membrane lipoprotein-sorting protein